MASPFDRLPVELVDEIFEWLCPFCATPVGFAKLKDWGSNIFGSKYDKADALLQLTRTCKLVNAVATPHLYHHPMTSRWWLLARTLLARPDLGLHVRSLLDNDKLRHRPIAENTVLAPFPTEVQSHFADSALARATEEERHAITDTSLPWRDRMTWSDSSETLDMLVSLCPDVQEIIAIVGTLNTPNILIWSPQASLPNLRRFKLSKSSPGAGLSLNLLAQVATAAPNLTSVALFAVEQNASSLQTLPAMPSLVALALRDAAICSETLRKLLAVCPNLQSFTYHAAPPGAHERVTRTEIAHALVGAAPNLTSLELILDPDDPMNLAPTDLMMPSLAGLSKLEHLTLTLDCVLPGGSSRAIPITSLSSMLLVNLLPASIRTLSLLWFGLYFSVASEPLLRLASAAPDRFRSLKSVHVSLLRNGLPGYEEKCAEVVAAFEKLGVEILMAPLHI